MTYDVTIPGYDEFWTYAPTFIVLGILIATTGILWEVLGKKKWHTEEGFKAGMGITGGIVTMMVCMFLFMLQANQWDEEHREAGFAEAGLTAVIYNYSTEDNEWVAKDEDGMYRHGFLVDAGGHDKWRIVIDDQTK